MSTPIYDAAAWDHGFAPMDDDASHAAEQRHLEGAIHALGDDEWDDLPTPGGAA
jgi:hypothetical protein